MSDCNGCEARQERIEDMGYDAEAMRRTVQRLSAALTEAESDRDTAQADEAKAEEQVRELRKQLDAEKEARAHKSLYSGKLLRKISAALDLLRRSSTSSHLVRDAITELENLPPLDA